MNKITIFIALIIIAIVSCDLIITKSRGLGKRVTDPNALVFKSPTDYLAASVLTAKYTGSSVVGKCQSTLTGLTSDVDVFASCFDQPFDIDFGTKSTYCTVTKVTEKSSTTLYTGDYFISFGYGKMLVLNAPQSSGIYYPFFTCAQGYCDPIYFQGCDTKISLADYSAYNSPILFFIKNAVTTTRTADAAVDFCKGGSTSCCAIAPGTCPGLPASIDYITPGVASWPNNYVSLKDQDPANNVAVAQVFNAPTGSTLLTSFTFQIHVKAGAPVPIDAYVYEWDATNEKIKDATFLYRSAFTTSAGSHIAVSFTVSPPLNLNPTKNYTAVLSLQNYANTLAVPTHVKAYISQYVAGRPFGYSITYGKSITANGKWTPIQTGNGVSARSVDNRLNAVATPQGSFAFKATFNSYA